MGKALIILVLGSISIYLIVNLNVNNSLAEASQTAINYYAEMQARNIANSSAEMLLAKLGDDNTYRVNNSITANLLGGISSYRVVDTVFNGDNLIKIAVKSSYLGITRNVDVYTKSSVSPYVPGPVKAAITTNNNIQTLGNLVVDGRNHDKNGVLTGTPGTLGFWTTGTYNRSGNSKVGSTSGAGVDISPRKTPMNNDVRLVNQVYPGGYPTTPDSILGATANGFPPGKLKSIAQSGVNGSQYTTNPSSLSYPLKGVTFVELPSGSTWNSSNITGEGILIVHNSANNAVIKNLNWGPFKGMLIADDIDKIHCEIIGAVIVLSPSPPSGNCIGNGSGEVKYSSEAIEAATAKVSGATPEYGFGKKRMKISAWYE